MNVYDKKNHLPRIRTSFILFLFVLCFTMNVLFCSTYTPYELLDKTTVIKTLATSGSIVANGDDDISVCFNASFFNKNSSLNETAKEISTISLTAAIPKKTCVLSFLIIIFLFFFLILFTLLPDERTLINQKVRLDN